MFVSVTRTPKGIVLPTSQRLLSVICPPGQSNRDNVTNHMDIHDLQFSRRDNEKFVTAARLAKPLQPLNCHGVTL
jgi:hypothetical protein